MDTVSDIQEIGKAVTDAAEGYELIGRSGFVWRKLLFWLPLADVLLKVKDRLRPALRRARWAWDRRGVFSGEALQDFLDRLLRTSPLLACNEALLPPPRFDADGRPNPHGRWLTFRDFREVQTKGRSPDPASPPYFPPLFLSATEVTTRRLELINSVEPRYFDWPVVKAVRASAGFPGFFTPVDHDVHESNPADPKLDPGPAGGERSYVDGGVIANFPAFVFGNRFRRWLATTAAAHQPECAGWMTRPWVHVGLRLSSTRQERPAAGERRHPETFVRAMLDLFKGLARSELEDRLTEFVPRSIQVVANSEQTGGPAGVLDVDALRPHIVQTMFDQGMLPARQFLGRYRFNLPESEPVEDILRDALALANAVFPIDPARAGTDPKFRANVFVPQGTDLVLAYRANMDPPGPGTPADEANTDRTLQLDLRNGLSGLCYAKRQPLLLNMQRFARAIPGGAFGFNPTTQATIRPDRTWLLSVPIFDPEAVLPGRLPAEPVDQVRGQDYAVALDGCSDPADPHVLDGAVFGVLNLDAGWVYAAVGIDEDPKNHRYQIRIRALVAIMRSCALRIGALFSERFPSLTGEARA
jgi:predicted acylesterase/phospholipase RssA